jgi:predicted alpha/beta hydrolase family esterase
VAPPDVDRDDAIPTLKRFAPTPQTILPFPTIVVASTDDPYAEPDRIEEMAACWGAEFVLLEGEGHINAASGLGDWRDGQDLLEGLLDARPRASVQALPGGRIVHGPEGETRRIWG